MSLLIKPHFVINKSHVWRQMFEQRICDDLCQEILQYLPIEDKLRLESVSKQFQRSVFERQYTLRLEGILLNKRKVNLKSLEAVVQKLHNLRSIEFLSTRFSKTDYNKVIQLVVIFCHKLVKINVDFSRLQTRTAKLFVKKFGPKLVSLEVPPKWMDVFMFFTNIEDLKQLSTIEINKFSCLQLNRLRKLSINYSSGHLDSLKSLAENCKSLRQLSITTTQCDQKGYKEMFKQILKLNNLTHFELKRCEWDKTVNTPNTYFGLELDPSLIKEMSVKFRQLKSFSGYFKINPNFSQEFKKHLNPFKGIKTLRRLHLELILDPDFDFSHSFSQRRDQCFGFSYFKQLENITHLRLEFYTHFPRISARILSDISDYLPNLCCFELTNPLSDLLFLPSALTKLKRLETLKLNIKEQTSRHQLIQIIEQNSKRVKSITYFNVKP